MSAREDPLSALRLEIERHPAVNHIFLNRCATSPFSREDYRVFGESHFPVACVSARHIDRLIRRADGQGARQRLEEIRARSPGEDARGLYERFLRAAKSGLPDQAAARVARPAHRFLEEVQRALSKDQFPVALGAVVPILAWAIPPMFGSLLAGLRRAGFSEEELRYFTLHQRIDQALLASAEAALRGPMGEPAAAARIRRGALLCLEAYGEFWSGAQSAVVRYRQPRAARPDGERPRSAPHEILLTLWDGSSFAQRLEQKIIERQERARPTLSELLSS